MEYHPFLQYNIKKSFGAGFNINSHGFRGDEITVEKGKDTYRIFILGGSTAYGVGVEYNKSVGKFLQDKLNGHYAKKIEVLNAGVSGYKSQHSIIDYLFRISDFKPDIVIMWHGINDLDASCSDPARYIGPFEPDYSHYLGPLRNMYDTYFYPPPLTVNLFVVDFTVDFIKKHVFSDFEKWYVSYQDSVIKRKRDQVPEIDMEFPSLVSYKRNLEHFVSIVRSDNATLILGNQPNMYSVSTKYKLNPDGIFCFDGKYKATLRSQIKAMDEFNVVTRNVAMENDVPFLDLDSMLPRTPGYMYDYMHWTEKGHQKAADELYRFIVEGNFVRE